MSLGFSNAGFEVIAGFDNWEDAVITYNNNFGHSAYNLDLDDLEGAIKGFTVFVDECPAILAVLLVKTSHQPEKEKRAMG